MSNYLIFISWILCAIPQQKEALVTNLNDLMKDNRHFTVQKGNHTGIHIKIVNKQNVKIYGTNRGKLILKGNVRIDIINSKNIEIGNVEFLDTKGDVIHIIRSENITIKSNRFLRNGSSPTGSIIKIQKNSKDVVIENNVFIDSRSIGIHLVARSATDKVENVSIVGNSFEDVKPVSKVYPKSNGNGMESIIIGWGTAITKDLHLNTLVEKNTFKNIKGDFNELISIKTSGNLILSNLFVDNLCGISLRMGNNNRIIGNTFLRNSKAIRVYGANHLIEDNVFDDNKVGIELSYADYSNDQKNVGYRYFQVENVRIQNNLFKNNEFPIKTVINPRKFNPKGVITLNNMYE